MIANYYEILNLTPKATPAEVSSNYSRLALRYHPKITKENPLVAAQLFSNLAQAYEVLSDPIKRAYFDKYGYEALKQGLYGEGSLKGGYRFGNNAEEIYDNFFKNSEQMGRVLDIQINKKGSLFGHAFGGLNYRDNARYQALVVGVPCTLEQLCVGTSKIVNYSRKVLNSDGRTTSLINQAKKMHIKPGYGAKTVLKFPREGHQTVHGTASDLLLHIQELPHPNYIRRGDDLIYTHWLTLAEAFNCNSISVLTLDKRTLSVSVDSIVSPRLLQEVHGEGMINPQTGKRGNLLIRFQVIFPTSLTEETKKELRQLLQ